MLSIFALPNAQVQIGAMTLPSWQVFGPVCEMLPTFARVSVAWATNNRITEAGR